MLLVFVGFGVATMIAYLLFMRGNENETVKKVKERAKSAKETVVKKGKEAKEKAIEVKDEIKEKAGEVKEKAGEVKEKIKDKAEDVKEQVEKKSEDVKEKMETKAEDVKEKTQNVKETVKEKAQDIKEKAGEQAEKAKEKATDQVGAPLTSAVGNEAKKEEPRPIQVITLGLGSENEAPGQVQNTIVPVPDQLTQSPSKDVATAREISARAQAIDDQTSSKDVQTAREPSIREPAAGGASPSTDVATAREPSVGLGVFANQEKPSTLLDNKPSEDVATAHAITDRSAAVVAEAQAEGKKEEALQKPKDESLRTDVTHKRRAVVATRCHSKAVGSGSNRESGEKKKSKKKKSKRSKKSDASASSGSSNQPAV
ncbi:hypothetical protein M3Y98_00631700 [Aphelenchoides besseyi]|nr:hypothetical protein M3Y98_00631700 [Aphelenchoides besseyi]